MNVNVVVDIEEVSLIDILGMLLGGGPEDHHWHLCERCCHIWDHDRPRNVSKRAYDKAHCCPECKSGPYRTAWPTAGFAKQAQRHLKEINRGRH